MKYLVYFFLLPLLLLPFKTSDAQPGFTAPGRVIIDTDGAPDDLRAISMLVSLQELEVLGISSSDGAVDPLAGYSKVERLLETLGRKDIPVAAGRIVLPVPPPWRSICEAVPWGPDSLLPPPPPAPAPVLYKFLLEQAGGPVIFVCLGGLTNLSDLLDSFPEQARKIRKIVWYNDGLDYRPGTNFALDSLSARRVLASGIPIDVITNLGLELARWTPAMISLLDGSSSPAAKAVLASFRSPAMQAAEAAASHILWDDLVPVYLMYPTLFDMEPDPRHPGLAITTAFPLEEVRGRVIRILTGNYPTQRNIVFETFPAEPGQYVWDVRTEMEQIIKKYGIEEWKAVVLTNEIHGHLGIYSIIGAKMGLKAKEILGAGTDQLRVISYASQDPPLSCMNDGLQASTGATLGMGTIRIDPGDDPAPRALFSLGNRTIELQLKHEYREQIEEDIGNGILRYGNLTDGYWKLIRRLGLKYWEEWDRDALFEVSFR